MNDLAAIFGYFILPLAIYYISQRTKRIVNSEPLLPYEADEYVYQMFGVRAEHRDELMIYLKSKGLATSCHYKPLSIQPLFRPWGNNCPLIEKEHHKFIMFPLHADLTNGEVDYVVERI